MSKQKNLLKAKQNKNDEFYTRYQDIEQEINAYYEYDRNFLRGKTILCPCDDSEWSNFTLFFAKNFDLFGLKKLISTCYGQNGTKGKILVMEGDTNGDGRYNELDLVPIELQGDGDFRSDEITNLRDEADIIITNPPFSLFREFITWLMEGNKKFLVLGNMNSIICKDIFPLIKTNTIWLGKAVNKTVYFNVPSGFNYVPNYKLLKVLDGQDVCAVPAVSWYTNIPHGRRNQRILGQLMTREENLRYNKQLIKTLNGATDYLKYDNYDAIEVPTLKSIPSDYFGVMGVPITFLGIHNPEEFEILGMCENKNLYNLKTRVYTTEDCKQAYSNKFKKEGIYDLNAAGVIKDGNELGKVFSRILVRRIN